MQFQGDSLGPMKQLIGMIQKNKFLPNPLVLKKSRLSLERPDTTAHTDTGAGKNTNANIKKKKVVLG